MGPVVRAKQDKPSNSPTSAKEAKRVVVADSEKRRSNRGLLFIKSIHHGFLERLMRTYFQQFGSVTRVRLALRTGGNKHNRSKGHAFIEFEVPQVAKIASDTMNDVKFKELLKTSYIGPGAQKINHFRADKLKNQNDGNDLSSNSSSDEEDRNASSSDTSYDTSDDGEEVYSSKHPDGRALLRKLVNQTLDEDDSSDEDFEMSHSSSAYDDESSSTSLRSLASKSKAKKQSASDKKSCADKITDSSVSETEAVEKHKNSKKTIQAHVSEKLVGGKRKRETNSKMKMKVSASESWVSSSESEVDKKRKRSKSKRVKTMLSTLDSDEEVVIPFVVKKKSKLYSKYKSALSKNNFLSDEDRKEVEDIPMKPTILKIKKEEQKKPKILKIKKGKSSICRKMKKGPKKSVQKKIVKKTPMELYTRSTPSRYVSEFLRIGQRTVV